MLVSVAASAWDRSQRSAKWPCGMRDRLRQGPALAAWERRASGGPRRLRLASRARATRGGRDSRTSKQATSQTPRRDETTLHLSLSSTPLPPTALQQLWFCCANPIVRIQTTPIVPAIVDDAAAAARPLLAQRPRFPSAALYVEKPRPPSKTTTIFLPPPPPPPTIPIQTPNCNAPDCRLNIAIPSIAVRPSLPLLGEW